MKWVIEETSTSPIFSIFDILNYGKIKKILEGLEQAKRAAEVAWDKKATDILLLDLSRLNSFADFFILCNAETKPQIEAIAEEITRQLNDSGAKLLHQEGEANSGWVLLDFGEIVVHIFTPQQREYYQLEKIWSQAVPVLSLQ